MELAAGERESKAIPAAHLGAPAAAPERLDRLLSLALGWPHSGERGPGRTEDERSRVIDHMPRLAITDTIPLRNVAVVGLGIVQLPTMMMICAELGRGERARHSASGINES